MHGATHALAVSWDLRLPYGSCAFLPMGDCPRQEGDPMIDLLLALVVAIAIYLVYAIIFPERF